MLQTKMGKRQAGFTLIEVLIAVSLLGLLSLAMFFSIRIGLDSQEKIGARLMDNRRMVGAQRVLEQELSGFMPVQAVWSSPDGGLQKTPFFGGDETSMRFVSSYSLSEAHRGTPQVLEFQVAPGESGGGVRLFVNEIPYRGGMTAGTRIAGFEPGENGLMHPVFFPIVAGGGSFVLADRLAYCHMLFLEQLQHPEPHQEWRSDWVSRQWPVAVRIEMAPLEGDPTRLHPVTVTAPLRAARSLDVTYHD
jgi:prepilin-type N-terminal cleavage/methylation domain-containing protein